MSMSIIFGSRRSKMFWNITQTDFHQQILSDWGTYKCTDYPILAIVLLLCVLRVTSLTLKLSCPAVTTQIYVFEICYFEMIRHHKSFTNHSQEFVWCSQYVSKTGWASTGPISLQFRHCFRSIFYLKQMISRFGTLFFQDPQLDGDFRLHFRYHGIIKTCGINRSRSVELV